MRRGLRLAEQQIEMPALETTTNLRHLSFSRPLMVRLFFFSLSAFPLMMDALAVSSFSAGREV